MGVPASLDISRAIKLDAVQSGVTMVDKLRALLLKHYGLAAGSRQKTTVRAAPAGGRRAGGGSGR